MRRHLILAAVIIALIALAIDVEAARVGGTVPLFNQGAGGRAMGMGGANVALANDASAVFWNPATLTNLQDRTFSLMYLPLPEGTSYNFAAFGWPTVDYGTFSFAAFLLTTGDIERRDESGRQLGTFSANDQMYLLGYGKRINDYIALGATVKLVGQSFDNTSAYGAGADVGLKLSLSDQIAFGFNAQNLLAPKIRIDRDEETLPVTFKAGAGVQLPLSQGRHMLSIEADVDKTEEADLGFHAGGELAFLNQYFIRAGYDIDQINFGAGLKFKFVKIAYTFRTQDYFEAQHRLSLDISLGGSIESILAQRDREKRDAAIQLAKEAREQELTTATTQARYFYQNGMYDSAEVYYQKISALTDNSDNEASERLSQITSKRTQELTAAVRAGVLAESDSAKAQELFADLDEALTMKDLEASNVMLSRLRPAFGNDDRFRNSEAQYSIMISSRISDLRTEGNRLMGQGKLTEAAQRYNEILHLNPQDASAKSSLAQINSRVNSLEMIRSGVAAYSSGDTVQARQIFEQVLAVNPSDTIAQNMLGRFHNGKVASSSLSEIQKDADAWKLYLEGIDKFRNNDYEQAIRLWEQVLDKYPGNSETEKNIQQAKLRLQTNGKTR